MSKKRPLLKVDSVLEFYDNPQLMTARDCFDTLYLCLLYEDSPLCKYVAIRISSKRLGEFLKGEKDLRSLFLLPEQRNEYFEAVYDKDKLCLRPNTSQEISEEKLPAEGYFLDKSQGERVVVTIPTKDKALFSELVKKFGWACM